MPGQGWSRVTDLEPGMTFQPDEHGPMVFDYADPAGVYQGRRWVRVTTLDGHRMRMEWDVRVRVEVDRP